MLLIAPRNDGTQRRKRPLDPLNNSRLLSASEDRHQLGPCHVRLRNSKGDTPSRSKGRQYKWYQNYRHFFKDYVGLIQYGKINRLGWEGRGDGVKSSNNNGDG